MVLSLRLFLVKRLGKNIGQRSDSKSASKNIDSLVNIIKLQLFPAKEASSQ